MQTQADICRVIVENAEPGDAPCHHLFIRDTCEPHPWDLLGWLYPHQRVYVVPNDDTEVPPIIRAKQWLTTWGSYTFVPVTVRPLISVWGTLYMEQSLVPPPVPPGVELKIALVLLVMVFLWWALLP